MSVDVSDGEPCDVYSKTHPRAKKEHTCCACKETIRRGDIYRKVFVVFDGDAETDKYCLRCAKMYDVINYALPTDEQPDPHLNCGHTWEELHGECPPDVARLAFLTPEEAQTELCPKP